ncbi:MAG: hypothetical protein HUU32_14085 [Calditrichaceae bacterium]|nr:hypothetical protein [Calditrichia bacterium]NUQ42513.1 hypothetical protein [Calditrichaceae bacterium]
MAMKPANKTVAERRNYSVINVQSAKEVAYSALEKSSKQGGAWNVG